MSEAPMSRPDHAAECAAMLCVRVSCLLSEGHIIIADFGLSHEQMYSPSQRSYSLSGTSEYLSPESILQRGHSKAMDWWQVGIVLHEMLTGGVHPFYHANLFRMQQNILTREPTLSESLSPAARHLISQLLIKEPDRRLGSEPLARDIESHHFFTVSRTLTHAHEAGATHAVNAAIAAQRSTALRCRVCLPLTLHDTCPALCSDASSLACIRCCT
jgi:serine/threonine protein kinase